MDAPSAQKLNKRFRQGGLHILRAVLLLLFILLLSHTLKEDAATAIESDNPTTTKMQALMDVHCVQCHGPGKQEGDVRLDSIGPVVDEASAELWEDIQYALEDGVMPPKNSKPALKLGDRKVMVAEAALRLKQGQLKSSPTPQTPMRRMTRFQYNNAVVDLLELKVDLFALPEQVIRTHKKYFDPASGKMPDLVEVGNRPLGAAQMIQPRLNGVAPYPKDLRAEHGFDNRGDHLSLSPLLMEEFLRLSRSIVNSIDFGPKTVGAWNWLFKTPPAGQDMQQAVEKRLDRLLTRAFRGNVLDKEHERYTSYVLGQIESGTTFTDAIKQAVSAILSSPRFLYLYAPRDEVSDERGDNFALASRLSFFLWGSIPDRELLDLSADGKLNDPDVLNQQLDRMLNNPKVKRFCDSFPSQWLHLEKLLSAKPDPDLFPQYYSRNQRASVHLMIEPLLLFETLYVENRSILDLIDPDFSYRTEVVKNWMHNSTKYDTGDRVTYQTRNLKFHRVKLKDRREGGVITNSAIMSMLASPSESKPISRGEWVASVIFNNPPKPAPPDVPPLPEDPEQLKKMTLRERLSAHRDNPGCAGCHDKIDPLGFALENYSPAGTWRDTYRNGLPVDSSGVLFNKHKFSNPVEFKDAILAEKDRFHKAFAKHLLSYALSRKVVAGDTPALAKITETSAEDGYKLRTLIRQVVLSKPFLDEN